MTEEHMQEREHDFTRDTVSEKQCTINISTMTCNTQLHATAIIPRNSTVSIHAVQTVVSKEN